MPNRIFKRFVCVFFFFIAVGGLQELSTRLAVIGYRDSHTDRIIRLTKQLFVCIYLLCKEAQHTGTQQNMRCLVNNDLFIFLNAVIIAKRIDSNMQ